LYQIVWKGNQVGNAEIRKEGMFYRFSCRCRLTGKGVYRVAVTDGQNKYDLGICIPNGNSYSCVARLPCNRLNGTDFLFLLTDSKKKRGIPIATGKPFAYLDKLNTARLQITDGQAEIIIDSVQDPQDNDPNPIHQNKSVQR